jgi:glycosyltransferase involved in cell wall biosynthesis
MRIALVVPGGVDASGEYRVIPALLAVIARLARSHDLQVFALVQQPRPAEWQLLGAHVHNIGTRATRPRAIQRIVALHREAPFDLVHAIWSGPCGLVAVAAAKLLRVPSLVHVAGGELAALPEIGYGGALSWRTRLRERLTLRGATAVSAASASLVQAIAAVGVSAQRVPLGVDLNVWPACAPRRRNPQQKARLIHVGSLNRVKDQATLMRALSTLTHSGVEFQMDVVGEDTLDGEIQSLTHALGLNEKVTFRGFLPQRSLRPLIEAAHLMVVSSRHEAGPLVVLEAAIAGVPVVGTAVGHVAEWAPHAALAVPVGEAAALAEGIGRLLADEELRLVIAREAQRRAMLEDADHTVRQLQAIYARLTENRVRHHGTPQ